MWENADDRMVRKRIDYGDVSIAYFSVCREKAMRMMKTRRERDTCTPMFIAALFIIRHGSDLDVHQQMNG